MNRASYYRPPAEGMFIIQDSGGLYFIGTRELLQEINEKTSAVRS